MSLYSPFKKKLENHSGDSLLRVLISFEDLSNREKFIKKYQYLKILSKYDFIPSINVNLKKDQVINLQKEELIKKIEEDQKLFLSILDIIEILQLDDYKNSQISYRGNRINVGIIDDGINQAFPSISKLSRHEGIRNIKFQQKEVTHGTIMASIIANQFKDIHNNYIGIAPNVNLFDLNLPKTDKEYYISSVLEIFEGINKDKVEIDILLISLTTSDPSDGKDLLSLACNSLVNNGLIIVSPAGNYGPEEYSIGSPGAAEKVITIGALTKELTIPDYSGRGPTLDQRIKPDLCLPSSNVTVPLTDLLKVKVTGTSVSAAIGAGIIALIKEYDRNISYSEIIDLMKSTRLDLNYEPTSQGLGAIRVTDLFENLDLFHKKLIPYNYLIKKSLTKTLEFMIMFLIIFYLVLFLRAILF
jgi:serine protease AprX